MSTQIRNSGDGRNKNKSNHTGGGGGGEVNPTSQTTTNSKKTDATKTEKEKVHPKPTAEQLRIAQITNSNASEDPQMREKVATLIEMTQRSEEEVCCALNECDNNLERAVVFLLETLPVGAFETSSKKKKNKAANAAQEVVGADGEWANDSNANTDKREKSRNRSSNRGGRGGTDSRGWRGREARENERNLRESRGGGGGGGGGDREDRNNDNYRGPRRDGRSGGRGGGFAGRGGRGGGRMGGGRGPRGDRGYGSRHNANEEHQEVELWDNTIAQNAEKQQQQQQQDDAWGDWDNEEYVGSLKDSKVFTTSNLNNQTAASVLSGGGGGGGGVGINNTNELSAPPGLEHHLGTSVLGGASSASASQQGSHLNALVGNTTGNGSLLGESVDGSTSTATGVQTGSVVGGVQSTTPMMQYSAAVSSTQLPQQQSSSSVGVVSGATQTQSYSSSGVDTFTNAATAAANLVQQVQQQQQQAQLKSSATLSAEQSQYFNSLASQSANSASTVQQQQQQQPMATYAQSASAVTYPQPFGNVFGTGATTDQTQQQPQVRRARAKLPPPSKQIPSSAVEMPGDSLNTIGYLDVQFGGLDFGADESFDGLSEKYTAGVNIDGQQQVQQEEVTNDYQNKASVQQQASLSSGLQNAQITDSLSSAAYTQRGAPQQQQTQVVSAVSAGSTLDQLKNDPYNQTNSASAAAYQNPYQSNTASKSAANAYQHVATAAAQGYNSGSYANVQSSVAASSYQPQAYSVYQQNSVNSYQQQHQQQQQTSSQNIATNAVTAGNNGSVVAQSGSVSGSSTQNIPVGNNSSANANSNTGYLSSGYATQPSAYQSSQSVYGNTGLSNNAGVSSSNSGGSNSSTSVSSSKFTNANVNSAGVVSNNNSSSAGVSNNVNNSNVTSNVTVSSVIAGSQANNGSAVSATVVAASGVSTTSNKNSNAGSSSSSGAISGSSGGASGAGAGGMVPTNIQMVSQYIQTGLPYYQQPVYSYEDLQMMQQRVQHVPGYYDINYTPTSLGAGRDNVGSVAYSAMTDGRFTRTDNNSSPVSNVSSTMSQQAGSSAPMLNVPYATYFYGGNVMPGSFQYPTPAIYPQQLPAANTPSGGQFPKPSYNTGYNSTSYDTLSQASQDYTKGAYQSNVNQQTKSQNVTNQAQAGTGSDITSTMYGKGHVALNKVNSYEKQNFHSGTPPPFNMANTQTAGGASAQPYGMYLPMPPAGHQHHMIHQPMHQMDGRIHSSSRRDSNSTGQRQQTSSQSKSANKQGYTPSYWTGQN